MLLNLNTKRAQGYISAYNRATADTIYKCYKKPSDRKSRIEWDINYYRRKCGGYDYRVLSYNSQMFTCAYRVKDVNGDEWLRVFTPYYDYEINLNKA